MEPSQQAIDNAVNAATAAAQPHSYEAVLVVLLVVCLTMLTASIVWWLIRSMDKRMEESATRENRMATRLNHLEEFVQNTLIEMVHTNSTMTATVLDAVRNLTDALVRRPCLLNDEERAKIESLLFIKATSLLKKPCASTKEAEKADA